MNTLGSRVLHHRQILGMSQQELAWRARITQPRVSQIERDDAGRPVPVRTLVDLADALGVGLAALIANDPVYELLEFDAFPLAGVMPAGLPAAASPLIGREAELAGVLALLTTVDLRLLTVTGPGGAGKTHLALQAARRLAHEFDQVTVVSLASCTTVAQLVPAIAHAAGVHERDARPLRDRLAVSLYNGKRLLLLDNLEQALPAAAIFIAELLADCPRLVCLVTSRARLHIRGEYAYPLAPLAVPDIGSDLARAADSPAVQLFVQRARLVQPALVLGSDNVAAISDIVRRLDGLPLAIELAAARATTLSPAAMVRRLESRLLFLTGGPRDLPARQRTMHAAIAWSHDLLNVEQRTLFRRLSIFAGGCNAAAIAAVAGSAIGPVNDEADPRHAAMLDAVAVLLDHSLLQRSEQPGGAFRFDLLETIREFATDQLTAAGETDLLQRRRLAWCLALARQTALTLFTAGDSVSLQLLADEDANFNAALGWAFGPGRPLSLASGLELAAALADYWYLSGRLSEGRDWLTRAVHLSAEQPGTIGQVKCLIGACLIEQARSEVDVAEQHGARGLRLARELGDQPTLGRALMLMGNLALMRGHPAAAHALHEEALACFRQLGDQAWTALTLINLGLDCFRLGDLELATAHGHAGLALARAIDDRWDTIIALRLLGDLGRARGDLVQAAAFLAGSLDLARRHGNDREIADCLAAFGVFAVAIGDSVLAVRCLATAETLYARLDITLPPPLCPEWFPTLARIRANLTPDRFREAWTAAGSEQLVLEIMTRYPAVQ